MSSLLSLGFEYKGSHHSFLARVKEEGNRTEYHITLMNGDLVKLLGDKHIIPAIDGQITIDAVDNSIEQEVLKAQVAMALTKYLREKSLTSY